MKQHIEYYKNMGEIWNTNYKYHFVCFDCKISWKTSYITNNIKCISCKQSQKVRNVGVNFRVPKKTASDSYWKKIEKIVLENHIHFQKPSCESIICNLHKHIYWQGNLGNEHNCQVPYSYSYS